MDLPAFDPAKEPGKEVAAEYIGREGAAGVFSAPSSLGKRGRSDEGDAAPAEAAVEEDVSDRVSDHPEESLAGKPEVTLADAPPDIQGIIATQATTEITTAVTAVPALRARRTPTKFTPENTVVSRPRLKKRTKALPVDMGKVLTSASQRAAVSREQLLIASNVLIPAVLRKLPSTNSKKKEGDIADYHRLFRMGFVAVCREYLGNAVVEAIKSSKYKKVRDFFEIASPTQQCDATIPRPTGETPCWLCQKELKSFNRQCEHKFPILFALVFTGLYDSELFAALFAQQRLPYVRQLANEYAWAHQRCNMIKNDTMYAKDDSTGEVVQLTYDEDAINTDLELFYTASRPTFEPKKDELQKLIGDKATWKADALRKIKEGLVPILNAVNGKPKAALFASFTKGIKDRAKVLLGISDSVLGRARANPLSNRLSRRAQASLPRILSTESPAGGRRKTRHRRGRRRTYRGGTKEEEEVLEELIDHIHDIVKEENAAQGFIAPADPFTIALAVTQDAMDLVYEKDTALDDLNAIVLESIRGYLNPSPLTVVTGAAAAAANAGVNGMGEESDGEVISGESSPLSTSAASASKAAAAAAAPAPSSAAQTPAQSAFQSPVINPYDTGAAFASPRGAQAATEAARAAAAAETPANARPAPAPAPGSASAAATLAATQTLPEAELLSEGGRRRTRKRRTLRRQRVRT